MKLKLDSTKKTKNNNEEQHIDFIVQSEGIEIFVDEYQRLCGLLRTRQPNREWKVGEPQAIFFRVNIEGGYMLKGVRVEKRATALILAH